VGEDTAIMIAIPVESTDLIIIRLFYNKILGGMPKSNSFYLKVIISAITLYPNLLTFGESSLS
jgi:hypothetical protein